MTHDGRHDGRNVGPNDAQESERTEEPNLDWPEFGHVFRAGEIAARRYRIERLVGQGAMGEVYAAHDLELGSQVALKVLHLGPRADREAIGRFKREILLARRVSHPNVCRIFDLGVHWLGQSIGRDAKPLLFLTMELLEGETLVHRLERDGPLAEEEATRLALQLCAALTAAHAAGVVHRDLKCSNIVLVPAPDGPRAVITDFGLAREQRSDPHSETWTETGGVLGTPAYMSPEQVEGKVADNRSDLYSLGIVLYEMTTGRMPFEGESPLSIAMKRVREEPTPIEQHRASLSPRWRGVVARLLARDPAARFQSPSEVSQALDGRAPVAAASRPQRWPLVVGAAAAAVAVLAGFLYVARHDARSTAKSGTAKSGTAAAATPARRSFAVLPLRNASGDAESAWLSIALAEMLTTELAEGGELRAVPGEVVVRAVADLGLTDAVALGPESLQRLRKALGADVAVIGSYLLAGPAEARRVRLDLRVQPLDGGELETRASEGSADDLFALAGGAGRELRSALGLADVASPTPPSGRSGLPGSEAAIRLYSLGLDRLRHGEPLAAKAALEAALADDPESALAWAALSEAWTQLGYSERARVAARSAFERADGLSRVEALQIEGMLRRSEGSWDAAIEIQSALWRLFRDDQERGIRLAETLLDAGRARDARATVGELEALPGPAHDDPRIDLVAARVAEALSELDQHLAAARRAAAKARAAGSRSILVRALYEEGIAQRKLGRPGESRAALIESRRLADEAGDRHGAARAMLSLANVERAADHLDEAKALYDEARAVFESIGNRQLAARAEMLQGLLASQRGEIGAALELYESALAKLREVDDRRGAAAALSNIGTMLYERGDLAGALARHEQAIVELRALGDETKVIVSLANLAQIRFDRGELGAAARDLDEQLELARRIGDRTGEAYALRALAQLACEAADWKLAESRFREAERRFESAGQTADWLRARFERAVMERQRGAADESVRQIDGIFAELERAGPSEDRDEARLERLRALVAGGREAEVADGAAALFSRARASESSRVRHLERFARAELALALGRLDEARRVLIEEESAAVAGGLTLLALDARASLALLAIERGEPGAADAAARLRARAEELGAGRIAARLHSSPRG